METRNHSIMSAVESIDAEIEREAFFKDDSLQSLDNYLCEVGIATKRMPTETQFHSDETLCREVVLSHALLSIAKTGTVNDYVNTLYLRLILGDELTEAQKASIKLSLSTNPMHLPRLTYEEDGETHDVGSFIFPKSYQTDTSNNDHIEFKTNYSRLEIKALIDSVTRELSTRYSDVMNIINVENIVYPTFEQDESRFSFSATETFPALADLFDSRSLDSDKELILVIAVKIISYLRQDSALSSAAVKTQRARIKYSADHVNSTILSLCEKNIFFAKMVLAISYRIINPTICEARLLTLDQEIADPNNWFSKKIRELGELNRYEVKKIQADIVASCPYGIAITNNNTGDWNITVSEIMCNVIKEEYYDKIKDKPQGIMELLLIAAVVTVSGTTTQRQAAAAFQASLLMRHAKLPRQRKRIKHLIREGKALDALKKEPDWAELVIDDEHFDIISEIAEYCGQASNIVKPATPDLNMQLPDSVLEAPSQSLTDMFRAKVDELMGHFLSHLHRARLKRVYYPTLDPNDSDYRSRQAKPFFIYSYQMLKNTFTDRYYLENHAVAARVRSTILGYILIFMEDLRNDNIGPHAIPHPTGGYNEEVVNALIKEIFKEDTISAYIIARSYKNKDPKKMADLLSRILDKVEQLSNVTLQNHIINDIDELTKKAEAKSKIVVPAQPVKVQKHTLFGHSQPNEVAKKLSQKIIEREVAHIDHLMLKIQHYNYNIESAWSKRCLAVAMRAKSILPSGNEHYYPLATLLITGTGELLNLYCAAHTLCLISPSLKLDSKSSITICMHAPSSRFLLRYLRDDTNRYFLLDGSNPDMINATSLAVVVPVIANNMSHDSFIDFYNEYSSLYNNLMAEESRTGIRYFSLSPAESPNVYDAKDAFSKLGQQLLDTLTDPKITEFALHEPHIIRDKIEKLLASFQSIIYDLIQPTPEALRKNPGRAKYAQATVDKALRSTVPNSHLAEFIIARGYETTNPEKYINLLKNLRTNVTKSLKNNPHEPAKFIKYQITDMLKSIEPQPTVATASARP